MSKERHPHHVTVRLWEPIEPLDRGERYEDPLQDALESRGLGTVEGGGTQLASDGEVQYAEIELSLADLDGSLEVVRQVLTEAGAPRGSELRFRRDGSDVVDGFGLAEGLAIYLDGTTLSDEVYATADGDELVEKIEEALAETGGSVRNYWPGPMDTAVYVYGPDAERMLATIEPLLLADPQCENARIVVRHGNPAIEQRTLRLPRK